MKSEVKKIDYTGQEIYCGLDVHKKRWQMTVCTKHTIQRPVSIERPFVQNLKRHLEKKYPGGILPKTTWTGMNTNLRII
jgi:hypothetical protein